MSDAGCSKDPIEASEETIVSAIAELHVVADSLAQLELIRMEGFNESIRDGHDSLVGLIHNGLESLTFQLAMIGADAMRQNRVRSQFIAEFDQAKAEGRS